MQKLMKYFLTLTQPSRMRTSVGMLEVEDIIQRYHAKLTAYIGGIYVDGSVGWKKEIWFIGGYTDEKGADKVTTPLIGRWIGWKVIMYNINNDTAVKLESYIDNTNTNFWIKVSDLVDDGGWYSKSNDSEFFSAGCDRDKDFVVTNGGPVVTFRSDNLTWEFKDLSIREIDPGITENRLAVEISFTLHYRHDPKLELRDIRNNG